MMQGLETTLGHIYLIHKISRAFIDNPQAKQIAQRHGATVDFIKGQPTLNLTLETGKDCLTIVDIQVNHLAI